MNLIRAILLFLILPLLPASAAPDLRGVSYDFTTKRASPTNFFGSNVLGGFGVTVHLNTNGTITLSNAFSGALSNLSYAIGASATNYTDARAVALSNLSYAIGTAGTNYTLATSNLLNSGILSKQHGSFTLSNLIAMGITNIVSADGNIVITTNAGVLTLQGVSGGAGVNGLANSNLSYAIGTAATNYTDSRAVALSNLSYAIGTAATNYSLAASNGARLAAGIAATNHAAAILQAATNYADLVGGGGGSAFGNEGEIQFKRASTFGATNKLWYSADLQRLYLDGGLYYPSNVNGEVIALGHGLALGASNRVAYISQPQAGIGDFSPLGPIGPMTLGVAYPWTEARATNVMVKAATASRPAFINAQGYITNAGGTPDGTKFLRDDGVLAVPAGTGGGSAAGTNNLVYAVDSGVLGILQTNGTDSALALITAVLTPGLGTAQVKGVVESNGVFMFALSSKATGLDGLVKESALFMPVPPGARYYWTNLSTGSGATAAILTNTHWRVRIQTAGTNTGSGGGPITPWTSTIDGAGYNLTNAGSADIAAVALPVSLLFGGGSASRWTTNLSAHALIVPTNLVAGRRYEVTIVSAGFSAVVSNSAAIRWTDGAFDGNCSTNGTTTLTVWKDLVTGFTNGIVEGPEFTFVPGSDVVMTTNFLARTVTLNGVFTETAIATNTTPATNSALSWAVSQQTQFHLQSSHFYLTNHTGRAAGSVANGTIYLSCTNGGTTTLIFPTLGAASGFPTNASQPLINIVTNAVTVALSWSRRGTNVHLSTTAWR